MSLKCLEMCEKNHFIINVINTIDKTFVLPNNYLEYKTIKCNVDFEFIFKLLIYKYSLKYSYIN